MASVVTLTTGVASTTESAKGAGMNLRGIDPDTMLSLTSTWLSTGPQGARDVFEKSPRLGHFLDDLEAVKSQLLAAENTLQNENQALAEIRKQENEIDAVHDRKVRGVSFVLDGLIELADDAQQRAAYSTLRSLLIPDGLSFITRSFRAEAGHAEKTASRLDSSPVEAALLKSIPLPNNKTLAGEVKIWLDRAAQLGALEAKREKLEAEREKHQEQLSSTAHTTAKSRWIKIVSSMLSVITLEDEIPEDIQKSIVHPLEKAAERANKRAQAKADHLEVPQAHVDADDPQGGF